MATTSSSAETVLHLHTLGVLEEFTKTSKFGLFFRSALMFHLTVKEFVHFWSKKLYIGRCATGRYMYLSSSLYGVMKPNTLHVQYR